MVAHAIAAQMIYCVEIPDGEGDLALLMNLEPWLQP